MINQPNQQTSFSEFEINFHAKFYIPLILTYKVSFFFPIFLSNQDKQQKKHFIYMEKATLRSVKGIIIILPIQKKIQT